MKTGKRKYSQRFMQQLQSGQSDKLIQKVAHTLNQYPFTRDSDVALAIKLLQTFYPDFIDYEGKVYLKDFHKLPKFYDMQRLRAKIQNEYHLFLASREVRIFRKNRQTVELEKFLSTQLDYSPVFVFADESGKTDTYLVIGTLWLYSSSNFYEGLDALHKWRRDHSYDKEFHFKHIKDPNDVNLAYDYFSTMLNKNPFSAFKAIIVSNSSIASNRRLDVVYEALSETIITGLKTEFETSRIQPPITIHLVKDADPSTDVFKLLNMNRQLVSHLNIEFTNTVRLNNNKVQSIPAENNDFVQIADLFSSSISRAINYPRESSDTRPKTILANSIISLLQLRQDSNGLLQSDSEYCKLLYY